MESINLPKVILARFAGPKFRSHVFGNDWDAWVELWAPKVYGFVRSSLGEYGTEPLPDILPMADADHAAGANASFNMATGQITLHPYMSHDPGTTLEKLTHEMVHGSLSKFPDSGEFFDEGVVDHSVLVLSKSTYWGEHQPAMERAAQYNLTMRCTRAYSTRTEYDRQRWMGGICSQYMYGDSVVAAFRQKKLSGDFSW